MSAGGAAPTLESAKSSGRREMRRLIIIPSLLAAAATAATALASSSPATTSNLAAQLALARVATAKYANDLGRAKADGYQIITPMIPNMGYHFLNPNVKGFDIRKPAILVYQHRGGTWQLGTRVGIPEAARDRARTGCEVRRVRSSLSLRRRQLRVRRLAG